VQSRVWGEGQALLVFLALDGVSAKTKCA